MQYVVERKVIAQQLQSNESGNAKSLRLKSHDLETKVLARAEYFVTRSPFRSSGFNRCPSRTMDMSTSVGSAGTDSYAVLDVKGRRNQSLADDGIIRRFEACNLWLVSYYLGKLRTVKNK